MGDEETKPLNDGNAETGTRQNTDTVVGAVHVDGIGGASTTSSSTSSTSSTSNNIDHDDAQQQQAEGAILALDIARERATGRATTSMGDRSSNSSSSSSTNTNTNTKVEKIDDANEEGQQDHLAQERTSPPSNNRQTTTTSNHTDITNITNITTNDDASETSSAVWSAMPGPVPSTTRLQVQEPFFISAPPEVIPSARPVNAELAFDNRAELEAHITRQVENDVTQRLEREYYRRSMQQDTMIPLVVAESMEINNLAEHPDQEHKEDEQSEEQQSNPSTSTASNTTSSISAKTRNRLFYILVFLVALIGIGVGAYVSQRNRNDDENDTHNNNNNNNSPTITDQIDDSSPSQSPTQASRVNELLEILEPYLRSDVEGLGPFQSRAVRWVADVDQWRPTDQQAPIAIQYFERYVAVVFYFTTLGGNKWTSQLNFMNETAHYCDWNDGADLGVHCDLDQPFLVFNNDKRGLISSIDMRGNQLGNEIPLELYDLIQLKQLTLGNNTGLGGTMSTHIGNLKDLKELDLSNTVLSGTIPTEMGLMAELIRLGLSDTQLIGAIPTEFGLLRSAQVLQLNSNMLSASIPVEIGNLTDIQELYFGGTVGQLPTEIGLLTQLRELHVHDSSMTGTVPTEFGKLINLQTLGLSENGFSGPVPSELGDLGLRILQLSGNSFEGTIPTDFARLTDLEIFEADHNPFLFGDLDPIFCHNPDIQLRVSRSDCGDTITTGDNSATLVVTPSRMTCSCCTECCDITGECPTQEPYDCNANNDQCIRCGPSQELVASCDMCSPLEDLLSANPATRRRYLRKMAEQNSEISSSEQAGCLGSCHWNILNNTCETRVEFNVTQPESPFRPDDVGN